MERFRDLDQTVKLDSSITRYILCFDYPLHRRNSNFKYVHYFSSLISEKQPLGCVFACLCIFFQWLQFATLRELESCELHCCSFSEDVPGKKPIIVCTMVLHRFPEAPHLYNLIQWVREFAIKQRTCATAMVMHGCIRLNVPY